MVLAVLYEGLKSLREYLMCVGLQSSWNQKRRQNGKKHAGHKSEDYESLLVNDNDSHPPLPGSHRFDFLLSVYVSFSVSTGN